MDMRLYCNVQQNLKLWNRNRKSRVSERRFGSFTTEAVNVAPSCVRIATKAEAKSEHWYLPRTVLQQDRGQGAAPLPL